MTAPGDDGLETIDPYAAGPDAGAATSTGWAAPTAVSPESASSEAPPRRRGPRPLVIGVLVAMLLAALGGFIVSSALQPGSEFPSAEAPAVDPSADVLGGLGLQQGDVADAYSVVLIPDGNLVDGQVTLDFCDGRYPSESLRSARLQSAALQRSEQTVAMSTEAVLYQSPAATAQAFRELQATADRCGDLIGKPGADWPKPDGVERLVYDQRDAGPGVAPGDHTLLVYLRRGRALLALYFSEPDGPQSPIAGRTTVEDITQVFQDRLAALPASAVG